MTKNSLKGISPWILRADAFRILLSPMRLVRPTLLIICMTMIFGFDALHAQMPKKTRWRSVVDNPSSPNGAGRLELYDISGQNPVLINPNFPVKGVDYSPIRINESMNNLRWLSDIFWDTATDPFSPVSNKLTQNYRFEWMDGKCTDDPNLTCRGDLATMKQMNINMVRIYGFTSRFMAQGPPPDYAPYIPETARMNDPKLVAHVTHKQFLDECAEKGIYVMVGLYLNQTFWDKRVWDLQATDSAIRREINWYNMIYKEVVKEVADHPAVMGFTINNEVDGVELIYKDPVLANFFWSQARSISGTVKSLAPDKLCGVAFHDDPTFNKFGSGYMSTVPNIDYWGVNTYRVDTIALANMFFQNNATNLGFSLLPPAAKKPVLITEMGWPQTTRTVMDSTCAGMMSITDQNIAVTSKVATLLKDLGGKVIMPQTTRRFQICPGMFYFEFTDEWYKQNQMHGRRPCVQNPACRWLGTFASNPGFPGGWWDEAGFGIFSLQRATGVQNCASTWVVAPEWNYNGPDQRYDVLMLGTNNNTRRALYDEIRILYSRVPSTPPVTTARGAVHEEGLGGAEVEVNKELTFYPNPTKGQVRISYRAGKVSDLNIQVLDLSGSVVANVRAAGKSGEQGVAVINLKDTYGLKPGVYLIRFVGGNKHLGTKRVVIE